MLILVDLFVFVLRGGNILIYLKDVHMNKFKRFNYASPYPRVELTKVAVSPFDNKPLVL